MIILTILTEVYVTGYFEIGKMLLRQMRSLASILFGGCDPRTRWSQALLELLNADTAPTILEVLLESFFHAVEGELGPTDPYTFLARSCTYQPLSRLQSHSEARHKTSRMLRRYQALLIDWKAYSPLEYQENLQLIYGSCLNTTGRYEAAEIILSPVTSYLERWKTQGSETGVRVRVILRHMTDLSESLRKQGKFDAALALSRDIFASADQILGPQDPETTHAAIDLEDCLLARGLTVEAAEMRYNIEERLLPYILGHGRSE